MLFSCLGRGEGMYGAPNHDINALHQSFGPVATAGFFCNDEFESDEKPRYRVRGNRAVVCGDPFVHGFTSVIGLFTEPEPER